MSCHVFVFQGISQATACITSLTIGVDNLIDFMRIVQILGIVFYQLEARGEVVQHTAEVGFPPRLVVWELCYFSACHCPGL